MELVDQAAHQVVQDLLVRQAVQAHLVQAEQVDLVEQVDQVVLTEQVAVQEQADLVVHLVAVGHQAHQVLVVVLEQADQVEHQAVQEQADHQVQV